MSSLLLATSPSFPTRHCHLPIRKMSSLPCNIPIFSYVALSLTYQENIVFAISKIPIFSYSATLTYLSGKCRPYHNKFFSYAAISLAYKENVVFAIATTAFFLRVTLTCLSGKCCLCHATSLAFPTRHSHLTISKMSSLP